MAKNRVSQVFWDPIKNRVSPRSVLLEAVYLEALTSEILLLCQTVRMKIISRYKCQIFFGDSDDVFYVNLAQEIHSSEQKFFNPMMIY